MSLKIRKITKPNYTKTTTAYIQHTQEIHIPMKDWKWWNPQSVIVRNCGWCRKNDISTWRAVFTFPFIQPTHMMSACVREQIHDKHCHGYHCQPCDDHAGNTMGVINDSLEILKIEATFRNNRRSYEGPLTTPKVFCRICNLISEEYGFHELFPFSHLQRVHSNRYMKMAMCYMCREYFCFCPTNHFNDHFKEHHPAIPFR